MLKFLKVFIWINVIFKSFILDTISSKTRHGCLCDGQVNFGTSWLCVQRNVEVVSREEFVGMFGPPWGCCSPLDVLSHPSKLSYCSAITSMRTSIMVTLAFNHLWNSLLDISLASEALLFSLSLCILLWATAKCALVKITMSWRLHGSLN